MDGVLVFSRKAWYEVYNRTLAHFGHPPIGAEAFDRIFGNGTQADRAAYMPERSLEEIDEAYRRFFANRLDRVEVNPEAAPVLRSLARNGVRIALATNTNRRLAEAILDYFGLRQYFAELASADEAGAGKPDPAVLHLASERLGIALDHSVFVGDSRYDEEAARRAPVRFIGFRYGAFPTRIEELSAIAARIRVRDRTP
jgi:HAD superfamily hydrolase (TIGR01549 family)